MNRLRYVVLVGALLAALVVNVAAYAVSVAQSNTNRAALVVQLKDGTLITRCVSFTEPEITGYDLLRRANLKMIVDVSSGGAVCKISNSGCNFPAQTCFCDCQNLNQSCVYWIYYHQVAGAWKYSVLGAMGQKVTDGAVHGWVYGAGKTSAGGVEPPLLTFDQVCSADASAAPTTASTPAITTAPTYKATDTSTAIPTPTPAESLVSTPTNPVAPTLVPTATTTDTPVPASPTVKVPIVTAVVTVTQQPVATPAADAGGTSPTVGYLTFGVIAIALLGGWILMRRNTTRKTP
jgi:hypothetical protein